MEYSFRTALLGRSRSTSRNHGGLALALFVVVAGLYTVSPGLRSQQWFTYALFAVMALTALYNSYSNSGVLVSVLLAASLTLGGFVVAAASTSAPMRIVLQNLVGALVLALVVALPAHLVGAGLRRVTG
ncbi:hypothetical protein [Halorussus salinus]|uniref:hypothetical protein n=1 Tax=Halorussus salinus TaxID=1364935 RepID=UPI0010920478|nr:hypothetical protein [Halorussus salinus]